MNNAGVAYGGAFTAMDADAVPRMVMLNAATLASLTRLFVTDMVHRGAGRILNISSLSAFQAVPSMSLYAATKAFVLSFTRRARRRTARHRRHRDGPVPGLTDTEMVSDIASGSTLPDVPSFMISRREVGRAEGYEACMRGEAVRVPGARESDLGAVESDATALAGAHARRDDRPPAAAAEK